MALGDAHDRAASSAGTTTRHFTLPTLSPTPAALLAWVVVFGLHAGVSLSFSPVPGHRHVILFDAGITATVIAALMWLVLAAVRRARRQREFETAEVNDQVRNALQAIVNAEYRAETPNQSLIMESVARIDRTLRKLFPPFRA